MSFDPYFEWFRIKPSKREGDAPPDHYTLLGVNRFENDVGLIHEAALRRMKLLRQRQTGTHADLTQRLMNEISQARLCLTDPTRKPQYDFELEQKFPRVEAAAESSGTGTSIWLMVLAALLLVGGGTATYFAVIRQTEQPEQVAGASVERSSDPPPKSNEKSGEEQNPPAEKKELEKPKQKTEPVRVPKKKAPEVREAFVKLRHLATQQIDKAPDGDLVHLAAIATDADEEDPAFLDREGRLLGFQRKAGGKSQFLVAQRAGPTEPFTAELLVQGLPEGARLQGFALEPGELSCVYTTNDSQSLMQSKKPDKNSPWGVGAPLVCEGGPVKAAWPSMTADGKDIYCVQQKGGKYRVLHLTRSAESATFSNPMPIDSLGGSFSQVAVSPEGKTLVLRGPENLFVSDSNDRIAWSTPEPILPLRGFSGANRALLVSPCFSPDGKWLLFASNRDGGAGGFDLWAAPATALRPETTDLSKLAEKEPTKKKALSKKEPNDKPKSKTASDGPKKPVKKPAPPVATNDTPVQESISEWLVFGPHPAAPREKIEKVEDLAALEGASLIRRMPKADQQEKSGLGWKKANKFESVGVYQVAVSIRLKSNEEARLEIVSAPGGGTLWLDGPLGELSWGSRKPWSVFNGRAKGDNVTLPAGRHKLVGTICVAVPTVPLAVRLVSAADGSVLEGVSISF